MIAEALSLSQPETKVLAHAALLHDIGKIGIPEMVLWKSDELSQQERALFEKHAQCTYELLERLPFPREFADVPFIASCHHEMLDGSGYFRGLEGEEIPLLARILIGANEFDNLTYFSHRSPGAPLEKAMDVLKKLSGHKLDSSVVEALISTAPKRLAEIMETGPNFVLG